MPTTTWHPSNLFTDPEHFSPYALMILNQPINTATYDPLSKHASVIVCADGGGNHFHDQYLRSSDSRDDEVSPRLPDAVVGDLDSLRPGVADVLRHHQVPIVQDTDQYTTDFDKCLSWLESKEPALSNLIILTTLSGRVDQALSTLHALYTTARKYPHTYLLTPTNLTFALAAGENVIHFPQLTQAFTPNVGILPLCGPVVLTTHGLEWDVHRWRSGFGEQGRLSTSNHIRHHRVEVHVELIGRDAGPPLFTVELAERFQG